VSSNFPSPLTRKHISFYSKILFDPKITFYDTESRLDEQNEGKEKNEWQEDHTELRIPRNKMPHEKKKAGLRDIGNRNNKTHSRTTSQDFQTKNFRKSLGSYSNPFRNWNKRKVQQVMQ
jgi:hypothetical protein